MLCGQILYFSVLHDITLEKMQAQIILIVFQILQSCALVLRSVYNFSAWPGRRLERSNTHDSLVP